MRVLVLNAGSSTQKSALFELEPGACAAPVPPRWRGKLEWNGRQEILEVRTAGGRKVREQYEDDRQFTAHNSKQRAAAETSSLERMLANLWSGPAAVLSGPQEVAVVGHRIVHGGPKLTQPARIDAGVKQAIAEVSALAPLHNRAGLAGIELAEKLFPDRCQVAVFDTAFHRTLPLRAAVYPGPYEWHEHGIRRYGFHGINHEYCARRAAKMLQRDVESLRIVCCHLGSGCSLAAIHSGKSVDTTMGFTPLDGLMMGTRPGALDPGILTHLMRTQHAGEAELEDVLNHRSGLLGVSGISSDMRLVMEAAKGGNPRARLAFDIFIHRLRQQIAAMAVSLSSEYRVAHRESSGREAIENGANGRLTSAIAGESSRGFSPIDARNTGVWASPQIATQNSQLAMDALIFTAGIGENSAEVRRAVCRRLAFLGIELEHSRNTAAESDCDIAAPDSRVRVLVIRAQEDWAIAQECVRLQG